MTPNEYQDRAQETAIYPASQAVPYTILGLVNEAGEVAGKYKKFIRDNLSINETRDAIADELGDVQWYLANAARELGFSLEEIMRRNLDKLSDRANRGVLGGSGDKR